MTVNYEQKKAGIRRTFQFDDEALVFKRTEKDGESHELVLPYDSFGRTKVTSVDYPDMLRFSGFLFLLIGLSEWLYAILTAILTTDRPPGHGLFLFLGIGLIIWSRRRAIRQTKLLSTEGDVYVLQDSQHDDIINEILSRRAALALSEYGSIDFANDPMEEIGKYRWLERHEVVSPREADQYIAEVEKHHNVSERDRFPLLQDQGVLELSQSSVDSSAFFHFKPEFMHHKFSNNISGLDMYLDYMSIPWKYERFVDSPDHLKFAAGLAAFFTLLVGARALMLDEQQIPAIVLGCFALGSYIQYRRNTTTLRIYGGESGTIRVIEDSQLEQIHQQLLERRRCQFLSLYGTVDPEEQVENEIAKFQWLVDEKVLTQEEGEIKIAEVESEAMRKSGQTFLN